MRYEVFTSCSKGAGFFSLHWATIVAWEGQPRNDPRARRPAVTGGCALQPLLFEPMRRAWAGVVAGPAVPGSNVCQWSFAARFQKDSLA